VVIRGLLLSAGGLPAALSQDVPPAALSRDVPPAVAAVAAVPTTAGAAASVAEGVVPAAEVAGDIAKKQHLWQAAPLRINFPLSRRVKIICS